MLSAEERSSTCWVCFFKLIKFTDSFTTYSLRLTARFNNDTHSHSTRQHIPRVLLLLPPSWFHGIQPMLGRILIRSKWLEKISDCYPLILIFLLYRQSSDLFQRTDFQGTSHSNLADCIACENIVVCVRNIFTETRYFKIKTSRMYGTIAQENSSE